MPLPTRPVKRDNDKSDLMPGSKALTGSLALMSWVKSAVDALDWPSKQADFQGFPARNYLVLEVYCGAKGAVGSEEIEEWIAPDPVLQAEFPDWHPRSPLIMAFRKCHREAIQQCLSRVLDVALKARFGDDDAHQTPIDYCVVRSLDAWFTPRCGTDAASEASKRLEIQMWTDRMSTD